MGTGVNALAFTLARRNRIDFALAALLPPPYNVRAIRRARLRDGPFSLGGNIAEETTAYACPANKKSILKKNKKISKKGLTNGLLYDTITSVAELYHSARTGA